MRQPLCSMVMIARDEERHIRPCLESFWPHVDEIVICDTGSTDRTITRARRFARERGEREKLIVGHFDWLEHFGAARNYADSLASGRVLIYCDADDRIVGAANLRKVSRALLQEPKRARMGVLAAAYLYERAPFHRFWPFRFALAGMTHWERPVWECREPDSPGTVCGWVPAQLCEWQHARDRPYGRRDLRLCRAWVKDEPECPPALFALASEHVKHNEMRRAHRMFMRYLALRGPDSKPRAEVYRRAGECLIATSDHRGARVLLTNALAEWPDHDRARSLLAESCLALGEHVEAFEHASRVLDDGEFVGIGRVEREAELGRAEAVGRQAAGVLGRTAPERVRGRVYSDRP